jgi:anionic cell wall polymer biosynthesis LytR-Cps2A-Psr (LCP) family protein
MHFQRPRLWGVVLALAMVTAGSGGLAGPVSAASFHFSAMPWLSAAMDVANLFGGQAIVDNVFGQETVSSGSDGRITILLLGSDYRASTAGTGERTDSIIFMTINNSHQISAISLPRDVGNVPIAPGEVFKPKINGLYKHFKQLYGSQSAAVAHVKSSFEYAFQIQIDYVAFVRFTSLVRMVDTVGGVAVNVPKNIEDSRIIDARATGKQKGAKFNSGFTVEKGSDAPLCYTVGNPINWSATPNCTFALLYVRSRHGPGNSDWIRARRQQNFIFSAMKQITLNEAYDLQSDASASDFYTTLPLSQSDIYFMYNQVHNASLAHSAVLKPPKYASNVPGTQKQQLKLDVVRALFHGWFGPLN